MPLQKGTNKPGQSPKKATVSSPKQRAADNTALGSGRVPGPSDAEATRKADGKFPLLARHGLDQESRDYLREQQKLRVRYQPNPTRMQTPTPSAKPSGARSGSAGRKVPSSPKGTSNRHLSAPTARMNVATEANLVGQDGLTNRARELRLPVPTGSSAKVRNKPAGTKSPTGGTPKSPKSPTLMEQFQTSFGVETPPEYMLPTIQGIQRDENIEQNTPASKLDHQPDSERGANWSGLDDSLAMPPPDNPKPAKAKSKPMSEPEGVTAPKAGGRQDVLSPRTASKKAEKQIKEAAFWQEAYERHLRAEHGIARGFAPLSKPIPEDLLTITDMKEQKWTAMVYWSDVLDKNFIGHVKAVPEDALAGKRAHSFPKHMFEHMKNTWLELTEVDQLTAGENRAAQIQAKKDLKAQQQRIKAEQRQKREELALWNASFHDEEDHVDYEPSDNEQDGGVVDDSENDSEGDSSPLPRRRINRGEEELQLASEREKSKTVADEGKITKSSDKVERKKKADSQPKPTTAEKKAAKTKVRQADRAVIAKQAADLKKQDKKRKQTQEYFAGVCFMCKEEGHIAKNCPKPICSNCGEGHHLEHCPQIKCLGCIAYKTKDDEGQPTAQGHRYWNCPYRAERPFCTFCKSKGHEITACTASGCKKASKAAAEREATERAADSVNADLISEDYDPNEPGLGFDPAPRAPGWCK